MCCGNGAAAGDQTTKSHFHTELINQSPTPVSFNSRHYRFFTTENETQLVCRKRKWSKVRQTKPLNKISVVPENNFERWSSGAASSQIFSPTVDINSPSLKQEFKNGCKSSAKSWRRKKKENRTVFFCIVLFKASGWPEREREREKKQWTPAKNKFLQRFILLNG